MATEIVAFNNSAHRDEVIRLWELVFGYEAPHNAPALVIDKKLAVADGLFFVALSGGAVVGTVMAGYDGHRGWIYSMAVHPDHRHRAIGSRLLSVAEERLASRGCMKINLQIMEGNEQVRAFYEANGCSVEERISMGKRLPESIGDTLLAKAYGSRRRTKEPEMSDEQEHVEVRCLRDGELQTAYAIKRQYLDGAPFDEWVCGRQEYPDLFVACLRQGELIGIAYGRPSPRRAGTVNLGGIAVVEEFARKGYGSQLLRFFDQQAERAGYGTVSVGAAGGYVDHFYMENDYEPVAFMITVPVGYCCPPDLRERYRVVNERVDGDVRRFSVSISSLDNELRESLRKDFNAIGICAIMDKKLGDRAVSDRDRGS